MKAIMLKRLVVAAAAFAFITSGVAATLTFDADTATPGAQDGGGAWDAAGTNWWDGAANTNWDDATPDSAVIGAHNGAAGTNTLTSVPRGADPNRFFMVIEKSVPPPP